MEIKAQSSPFRPLLFICVGEDRVQEKGTCRAHVHKSVCMILFRNGSLEKGLLFYGLCSLFPAHSSSFVSAFPSPTLCQVSCLSHIHPCCVKDKQQRASSETSPPGWLWLRKQKTLLETNSSIWGFLPHRCLQANAPFRNAFSCHSLFH